MKLIYKKLLMVATLVGALSCLAACGTVDGVGKDVEDLGEEIQDASN